MQIQELVQFMISSSVDTLTIFVYALIGGFVPALFWLWFWMHEKHAHTVPRRVIARIFLLGMISVFLTYALQRSIGDYIFGRANSMGIINYSELAKKDPLLTLVYVIIEEVMKFGAAYVVAFKTKYFKEPVDAFIYLMTAAVGFSAMENTLYLVQPLLAGQTMEMVITSHLRFIGSSVLHVTTSGILAVCIGLSFWKKSFLLREAYVWLGLTLAIFMHWMFNTFLVVNDGSFAFLVFSSVWIVTILLIMALEGVKKHAQK